MIALSTTSESVITLRNIMSWIQILTIPGVALGCIRILIQCHTDDVPLKDGLFKCRKVVFAGIIIICITALIQYFKKRMLA